MRKELYQALKTQLLESEETASIIQWVDLWNRNVEFIDQDTPWARPAVFIEFQPISWRVLMGGTSYKADGKLVLHIVTDWTGSDTDIEALDLSEKIQKALKGLSGTSFSAIELLESQTNHDHEDIVENIEIYSFKASREI